MPKQVVLHPRSLVALGGLWGADAGSGFGARGAAAHPAGALVEWLDRVRRFAEECDALQARCPAPVHLPCAYQHGLATAADFHGERRISA